MQERLKWCERGDSNPHAQGRSILSRLRLPFRHSRVRLHHTVSPRHDNALFLGRVRCRRGGRYRKCGARWVAGRTSWCGKPPTRPGERLKRQSSTPIQHMDAATVAVARRGLARFRPVGRQRVPRLHNGRRDKPQISPDHRAGAGLMLGMRILPLSGAQRGWLRGCRNTWPRGSIV